MFKDGQTIITSSINKINLLKKISEKKELVNVKIYGINEFNKLYYFDYDEETIYYIMNKYNIKYEIAKIYIENMYYIEDKEYLSDKLKFLQSLKKELIDKKLLKINKLFRNMLKDKDIVLYNLPLSKELNYLKEKLAQTNRVTILNDDEDSDNHHTIYQLPTIEEEVEFVANEICKLVKKGISLEKIYIANLNSEYNKLIKEIFPMYHIPFILDEEDSIYSTYIVTKFFENYNSDLSITLENLQADITTKEAEDIYNKIIDVINRYTFVEDKMLVKSMIKEDLKKIKIKKIDKVKAVHQVNINETIFRDDEYVFLMSFNQGIIPIIFKDENYLTDKENKELNMSLTVDKNNLEKARVVKKIRNIKNLIITYKLVANGEEFNISGINEILNYEVQTFIDTEYSNSNNYNKLKLASLLDEYYKYGTKSLRLEKLNNHYQDIDYKTYNHDFKGIDKNLLKEYLNNKLILSYSSLDKYYRCPFSFYIGNVLKLNIYEETFFQLVGTLFHSILEKFNYTVLTYDELWEQELKALNHEFTNKEIFFLNKLKEELKFIIEVLKEQEQFTNLHDELHEERVYVNLNGEMNVTFTGIIDKIKYRKTPEGETIVAIIDYKTGNPNLDLTTIPYGIGMQLPIYLYLIKNNPKLKNVKIAGFYLQKILNNEVSVDKTYSYEQLKKKNLLLQGYSNEDFKILSEFDNSYIDSNIIKSMKLLKSGDFQKAAKVMSTKNMDKIVDIAYAKIEEGAKKITQGEFKIEPKKQEKTNFGCDRCNFKDICFHTNDDIVELEKLTKEDVLGLEKRVSEENLQVTNEQFEMKNLPREEGGC